MQLYSHYNFNPYSWYESQKFHVSFLLTKTAEANRAQEQRDQKKRKVGDSVWNSQCTLYMVSDPKFAVLSYNIAVETLCGHDRIK
jgi:hypothetical protein